MRTIITHISVLTTSLAVPLLLVALGAQQDTTRRVDTTATRPTTVPATAPGGRAPQTLDEVRVRAAGSRERATRATHSKSSTRTETPLREIPQSLTALSAPLLRDINLPTVARALEYVPGVTMGLGEGHRDAPTIRGQSTTADFFVDGVRDDAQYLRDTYNVAQLDALRGPNAAVFGRGGGGGVINRVLKQAEWQPIFGGRVETGSWQQRRLTVDAGAPLSAHVAARVNALHEAGDGFRHGMSAERSGVTPVVALAVGPTVVHAGVEHLVDRRVVDRGVPSAAGRPAAFDARAFVGDTTLNRSTNTAQSAWVQSAWAPTPAVQVRTHLRAVHYDKFYRNVFANSAVQADGATFTLGGYSTATDRRSLFAQQDATWQGTTGLLHHTVLVGAEASRQHTDNLRQTAYFGSGSGTTSTPARIDAPLLAVPVSFRQSATDADNTSRADVVAAFAQEQVRIGEHLQLLGGVRADRMAVVVHDQRSGARFQRTDAMISPRAGVVVLPSKALSVYGSWSVSHLPSSGDQFGALTASSQTLRPEQFRNREAGVKWAPVEALDVTAAWYVLDRSNTTAPDPADATRLVQTGRQQTRGVELGVQGHATAWWTVVGGLAVQQARIVSRTAAARAGASVPLVPRTTASVWNRVRVTRRAALSLGVVHQGDRYAAIDNTVRLPHFTRLDGGLVVDLRGPLAAHVQVENLLDSRYTATSHGNNNIMPGAGRTLRLSLVR